MGWFRKINKNGEDYKPIGNVITATSLSVTGPDLADGDVVRVMFTTDIAGSDTSTPLALTWNGGATPIPVKASKEGSLASIYAFEYATNLYRYISAYVTLELAYDGTNQQFVVIGNPVILSGSDYTIYADGYKYEKTARAISPASSGYKSRLYIYKFNKTVVVTGILDFLGVSAGTTVNIATGLPMANDNYTSSYPNEYAEKGVAQLNISYNSTTLTGKYNGDMSRFYYFSFTYFTY